MAGSGWWRWRGWSAGDFVRFLLPLQPPPPKKGSNRSYIRYRSISPSHRKIFESHLCQKIANFSHFPLVLNQFLTKSHEETEKQENPSVVSKAPQKQRKKLVESSQATKNAISRSDRSNSTNLGQSISRHEQAFQLYHFLVF